MLEQPHCHRHRMLISYARIDRRRQAARRGASLSGSAVAASCHLLYACSGGVLVSTQQTLAARLVHGDGGASALLQSCCQTWLQQPRGELLAAAIASDEMGMPHAHPRVAASSSARTSAWLHTRVQPVPRAPSITQPLSPFRVATQPPLRVSGCPGEVLLPARPFLLPSSPQLRSAPSWACWRRSCSRAPRAWPRGRQTWTWLLWCPRKGAARAAQQGTAPALRAHRPDGAQAAVRISPQLAAPVGADVRRQCACGGAAPARQALTSALGRLRQSAGARTASSLQQAWQARVPLCDAHALRRSRCTVKTTRRRFHLLPRRGERGGACACGLALGTTHSAPAVRCGLTRARFGRRSWPAGRCTQRPSARCTGKQARPRSECRCADCGVCFLHRDLTHSSPSFRPRLTVWRQGLLSAASRRFDGGCVRAELLCRASQTQTLSRKTLTRLRLGCAQQRRAARAVCRAGCYVLAGRRRHGAGTHLVQR